MCRLSPLCTVERLVLTSHRLYNEQTCLPTTPKPFLTLHHETIQTDILYETHSIFEVSKEKTTGHSIGMVSQWEVIKVEQKAQVNRSLWSAPQASAVPTVWCWEHTSATVTVLSPRLTQGHSTGCWPTSTALQLHRATDAASATQPIPFSLSIVWKTKWRRDGHPKKDYLSYQLE